jgi:hypothetical protein
MQTEVERRREVHSIISWRRERLGKSGFPLALATEVAHDPRYDLHGLIELIESGCPPEVAVRILAPLDDGLAA